MIIPNFCTFLIIDSFCVLFSNLTDFLLPQEGHVGSKIAGSAPDNTIVYKKKKEAINDRI